jgi:hypothetical protein
LTEKVILNLTDCNSLSNHITAKTTNEKVISLTESNALLNQYDVLNTAKHAPAYGNEFGTCGVKFSMRDNILTRISTMQRVLMTLFSANNSQPLITPLTR